MWWVVGWRTSALYWPASTGNIWDWYVFNYFCSFYVQCVKHNICIVTVLLKKVCFCFVDLRLAGIFIRWLEWGSQNPLEPTASICVTLLRTLLNPRFNSQFGLWGNRFQTETVHSWKVLARCVLMIAAGATDSRHNCTIWLIWGFKSESLCSSQSWW